MHSNISFVQEWSYMEEIIANGLSQLGRSADGTMQVYLSLTLSVCIFLIHVVID